MPDNVKRKNCRTSRNFAGPVDPRSYCSYGASNFLSWHQGLKDQKGVSSICKLLPGRQRHILIDVGKNGMKNLHNRKSFSRGKSFVRIPLVNDICLRYIQFRTLHRRFYTNDILSKMGAKDSDLCNLCDIEVDSNEHDS